LRTSGADKTEKRINAMRTVITTASLVAIAVAVNAALVAPATAQDRGEAYCLTESDSGTLDCSYQTLSQCEQSKTGPTDTCGLNPQIVPSGRVFSRGMRAPASR
jgi:hypothetical protein